MKTTHSSKSIVAAITAIVGVAVYAYTSLTGYLAASATDSTPFILTLAALACLLVRRIAGEKLPGLLRDVLLIAAAACLIGSFYIFVMARVSLAADVYFIPVNYPAAEKTALHISVAGAVCYLVGIIALIAEGFSARD